MAKQMSYAKRFNVTGVTRDKEYDLTKGGEKSKVHYFSVNPNGEAEVVKIVLSPSIVAHAIKNSNFILKNWRSKAAAAWVTRLQNIR